MSKILKLHRRQYKDNERGFTLAELLVVVAIIAILVAVSISIFTGKLNEARQNTDLANERAAKAAAIADYLQSNEPETYSKYYDAQKGTMVDASELNKVKGYNQTEKSSDLKKRNNGAIRVDITATSDKLNIVTVWDIVDKIAELE